MAIIDVIVLGATGFTGEYIVKMLATINSGVKWGVAGRSPEKLKNLTYILENFSEEGALNVPTFICDAKDKNSLKEVCKKGKLIVNCIGPYAETGYAVVEACIENGTHYIDISVELNYILDLSRKYHRIAEEANVLVIPACGFMSLVSGMALIHLEENFSGTLQLVESYTDFELPKNLLYPTSKNALIHSASLDTALERIVNMDKCENLSKEMLPDIKEPAVMKRSYIHYRNGKIWVPCVFPDEAVANMSQKYLNEIESKPYIPLKMYTSCTFSWFFLFVFPLICIFYVLIHVTWFRSVVVRYPGFFTFGYVTSKGPNKQVARNVKCTTIHEGTGWSEGVKDFTLPANKFMKLKVTAYDGYQTTANAVVASILTLLEESSKMPRGGVINSGAAFRRTSIIQRLQGYGVDYEIIDQ